MDDWLTLVLAAGMAARLTRLIALDTITAPIRARLSGFIGAMAECAWCAGVWVAVPVSLSWWAWSDHIWWQVVAAGYTLAWASGAASAAAMPRQSEVMLVGPVAVVSADEPPEAPGLSEAEAEALARRVTELLRGDDDQVGGST